MLCANLEINRRFLAGISGQWHESFDAAFMPAIPFSLGLRRDSCGEWIAFAASCGLLPTHRVHFPEEGPAMKIQRIEVGPWMSQAAVHGDTV